MNNSQNNFSKVITKELLEKTAPSVTINNENKLVKMYHVIIYSDRIDLLDKTGILIQSKSEKFVTAIIDSSDLDKIYTTDKSVVIEIPRYGTTNN